MSNVRTLTPEDFTRYGDALKGKQVGDVITAEEGYQLEKEYAKKNGTPAPQVIKAETGVLGVPSSIDDEESEAQETANTKRSTK
jgi:hypothetical protein